MESFFLNKVVCITGSSQGIGKETARFIGEMGARVVLNGRNPEKLQKTHDELQAAGVDCTAIAADVAKPEECKRLVEEIIAQFGHLDVLINNAGIASHGRIAESGPETWRNIFDINTLGAINMTYYALPYLEKTSGSVVFISSMAAKVGVPGHAAYSASKMSLTAYAKALRIESDKVHSGLIYVGFTANEEEKTILNPSGDYQTIPQRKGVRQASREDVAMRIAKVVFERKDEVTLTLLGKLQHVMLKFAPKIVYMMLRRSYKDYDDMYS